MEYIGKTNTFKLAIFRLDYNLRDCSIKARFQPYNLRNIGKTTVPKLAVYRVDDSPKSCSILARS